MEHSLRWIGKIGIIILFSGFLSLVPDTPCLANNTHVISLPAWSPVQPASLPDGHLPWGLLRILGQPCPPKALTAKYDQNILETIGIGNPSLQPKKEKQIKIAIFDTGIDFRHPRLKLLVKGGIDLINDRPGIPMDDNGHGTHVAGIASMLGMLPGVELYAVKMLNSHMEGSLSHIIRGFQWAIDNGIDIINMSIGYREGSPAIRRAIGKAHEAGIVLVGCTGNYSNWDDPNTGMTKEQWEKIVLNTALPRYSVLYPGRYPEVIAAAHSTMGGRISSRANTGPELDIAAPGIRIVSTTMGGGYGICSGSSMAAAHVTAAVAMMLRVDPQLDTSDIKRILKATTKGGELNLVDILERLKIREE